VEPDPNHLFNLEGNEVHGIEQFVSPRPQDDPSDNIETMSDMRDENKDSMGPPTISHATLQANLNQDPNKFNLVHFVRQTPKVGGSAQKYMNFFKKAMTPAQNSKNANIFRSPANKMMTALKSPANKMMTALKSPSSNGMFNFGLGLHHLEQEDDINY
jgi:hypothetical protein